MWRIVLICGLAGIVYGQEGVREVPKYWRAIDGSVQKQVGSKSDDELVNLDKLQVVSSSLRILPKQNYRREKRSESSWRKPREYQFITRSENQDSSRARSARLVDQQRTSSNYYPEERSYYDRDDYFSRRNGSPPNRRIIYYATLPEVVRRPGEWTPPRPIYNPSGYPPLRDNEITRVRSPVIDVTRVQSSVIDVSDNKNRYDAPYSDNKNRYDAPYDLSAPKFTIIDAEPPYNRPFDRYEQGRYDMRYDNRYDQNRYDYNRFDYNRYDYRNYIEPPRYYDDHRLPPHRNQALPPQPITVVRKPLDVRPLDPVKDLTTQGPPISSSTTSSPPSSSSTSNPISSFERTFKF